MTKAVGEAVRVQGAGASWHLTSPIQGMDNPLWCSIVLKRVCAQFRQVCYK